MNTESIKSLYEYHFEFNRRLLDHCTSNLNEEQFIMDHGFSHGSVRNILAHMISVDERWFAGLAGKAVPEFLDPKSFSSIEQLQAYWKGMKKQLQEYIDNITDEELMEPFVQGLRKWQVLFHVVNHGTHHRAQVYAILNEYRIKALPQDYALFKMGRI